MKLAFQMVTEHRCREVPLPPGRSDEDRFALAELDTDTGERRTLVPAVHWYQPVWSADGERARYRIFPHEGSLLRDVDVRTLEVFAAPSEECDLPLPGFQAGSETWSPLREWVAYPHPTDGVCLARADGTRVYWLRFSFDTFAGDIRWSPCGTRLAVTVTADLDTGVYVLDLRTGDQRLLTPRVAYGQPGYATYSSDGWSPDGRWVVVSSSLWHDPKTYDYSLYDLWLFAADGTECRRLTDDGCSLHGAIRPTGDGVPSRESELNPTWAKLIRDTSAPPPAGTALAAQVRVDLDAGPPFEVLLMVRTADGLTYPILRGCQHIPDGFAKLDKFLADNGYAVSEEFVMVFERYATDDSRQEQLVRRIADLVFTEATTRGWQFSRDIPDPPAS